MQKTKDAHMDMRQMDNELNQHPKSDPIAKGLMITSNNLLKLDIATIETIARSIVQEVQDGNADALDVLIYAKKGAAFFKAIDDNVKAFAYSKPYATKGQPYQAHGCKVESAELGVSYDYKSSQDPLYAELLVKFDTAKKAKEDREKFLKAIQGKLNFVDDDGVGHTIYEPVKGGTMGYKISIG